MIVSLNAMGNVYINKNKSEWGYQKSHLPEKEFNILERERIKNEKLEILSFTQL